MKTRGNAFHLEFSAPPTKAPLLRGLYFSSTSLQYLIDANPLISHLICAHVNTHALEISDGDGRSAKRLFPFHSEGTNSIFLRAPLTCVQLPRDHLLILTPREQRSPCLCDWNREGKKTAWEWRICRGPRWVKSLLRYVEKKMTSAWESQADLTGLTTRGWAEGRRKVTPKAKTEHFWV